jgi:hypothetical protein
MKAPNSSTAHFSSEAWFDFARRVELSAQVALMQRHLDDGCKPCLRLYETWSVVLGIVDNENAYTPPETAVRLAKAVYAENRPWRPPSRRVSLARLIFDSFLQPAPAGSRTTVSPIRQTLYKSGPFVVELRIEPDNRRNRVFLVGQLVNSKTPTEDMRGVQVVIQREEQIVARATTNPFGEFHLEFGDKENLRLFVDVPGHRTIGIDLAKPEALRTDVSGESEIR